MWVRDKQALDVYTGRKIFASPGYVTVRKEGNVERVETARGGGSKTPSALSPSFRPRTTGGWPPTCVFVKINEARRYLVTSIPQSHYGDVGKDKANWIIIIWTVTTFSVVGGYQRLEEKYGVHLHGWRKRRYLQEVVKPRRPKSTFPMLWKSSIQQI
jgi:hypothetical protein